MSGHDQLMTEIAAAEEQLRQLRARRDGMIKDSYRLGTSKYRLAKDWGLNENTISRIVTGTKPGKEPTPRTQS